MGAYSLAQAKEQLDSLVEEALNGEVVTIMRDGLPVVSLTPTPAPVRPPAPAEGKRAIDPEYLDWMRKRAESRPSLGKDSVTLVREMRDEDE